VEKLEDHLPVSALDISSLFIPSPLLETRSVEILSAFSPTPNCIIGTFEGLVANITILCQRLSVTSSSGRAVCVLQNRHRLFQDWWLNWCRSLCGSFCGLCVCNSFYNELRSDRTFSSRRAIDQIHGRMVFRPWIQLVCVSNRWKRLVLIITYRYNLFLAREHRSWTGRGTLTSSVRKIYPTLKLVYEAIYFVDIRCSDRRRFLRYLNLE